MMECRAIFDGKLAAEAEFMAMVVTVDQPAT